jgi:hypothetical protein
MRLQLQRPGPPALVAALRSVVYGGSAVRRPLGDCRSHCRAAGLLDCTLCGLRAAAAAPEAASSLRGARARSLLTIYCQLRPVRSEMKQ